jgi:hypothetical protein
MHACCAQWDELLEDVITRYIWALAPGGIIWANELPDDIMLILHWIWTNQFGRFAPTVLPIPDFLSGLSDSGLPANI